MPSGNPVKVCDTALATGRLGRWDGDHRQELLAAGRGSAESAVAAAAGWATE
jgi:hypothetical protein